MDMSTISVITITAIVLFMLFVANKQDEYRKKHGGKAGEKPQAE